MTMRDDSNLRLLERDLTELAAPREGDELLRRALRRQLSDSARPRPNRRRSRRLALGWSAITASAAVVAILAVLGTTGSGGPAAANAAIVRLALRAITPPAHEILHVKVVGIQNGVPIAGETWQETSPPYASRGVKGAVGHQGEFGDNGTTSFQYDPESNTVYEQRDTAAPTFTDPISEVRRELETGQAQLVGTAVIAGTSLFKVALPHGLVVYFDQSSYRLRYLDDPQRDGSVVRLRVAAYGYIPMTSSNRALVSVTARHPGARIEAGPNAGSAK